MPSAGSQAPPAHAGMPAAPCLSRRAGHVTRLDPCGQAGELESDVTRDGMWIGTARYRFEPGAGHGLVVGDEVTFLPGSELHQALDVRPLLPQARGAGAGGGDQGAAACAAPLERPAKTLRLITPSRPLMPWSRPLAHAGPAMQPFRRLKRVVTITGLKPPAAAWPRARGSEAGGPGPEAAPERCLKRLRRAAGDAGGVLEGPPGPCAAPAAQPGPNCGAPERRRLRIDGWAPAAKQPPVEPGSGPAAGGDHGQDEERPRPRNGRRTLLVTCGGSSLRRELGTPWRPQDCGGSRPSAAPAAGAAAPAPGPGQPRAIGLERCGWDPALERQAAEAALAVGEYRRLLALGGRPVRLRGINIQRPWARLILEGKKTVEARRYALKGYLDEDLWVIETKGRSAWPGPLRISKAVRGRIGNDAGGRQPPGAGAKAARRCRHAQAAPFVSRIIGMVRFGSSFQYADLAQWRADEGCHCIPRGSPFDWQGPAEGPMHGWRIVSARALAEPQLGPTAKGMIGCRAVTRVGLWA